LERVLPIEEEHCWIDLLVISQAAWSSKWSGNAHVFAHGYLACAVPIRMLQSSGGQEPLDLMRAVNKFKAS
jgi:hypothetical protein